jgi:ABC-type transport system involved in Fe-S cluster assembly fused permease/ATPase subunit
MEHPMGVENPRTDISDLDADGRELPESELSATRVVVAHRLSTFQDADLILVMSDRQVAERGTDQDLVDLGGTYTRVVAAKPEIVVG